MANIFLHFLNRELLRSLSHGTPPHLFEPQLRILCMSTQAYLFTNFANVIEGGYFASTFFKDLIAADVLKFYGEKNSLEEYWESSAIRYDFDKDRYPYVSTTLNSDLKISPYLVRDFSMTSRLKAKLFEFYQNRHDKLGLLNSFPERKEFWELINRLAFHKGSEAMTMSLANNLLPSGNIRSQIALNNITGRLLSFIYLEEIINPLDADIATGISGLQFFDHISKTFPIYDVDILNNIYKSIGCRIENYENFEILFYRTSDRHSFDSKFISNIIKGLFLSQNSPKNQSQFRSWIITVLRENKLSSLKEKLKLDDISTQLIELQYKLVNSQPLFSEQFRQLQKVKTILIVTATDKETNELIKRSRVFFDNEPNITIRGGHAVRYLGEKNNYQIWHGQCEAGSIGPSGAQAITTDLIDALAASSVLMPGIAFGLNPKEQNIGDILVSTHVYTYEKERIGTESIPRADKVPASPKLLSVLRAVKQTWTKSKMHFGILMSGEKLVDNPEFVSKLQKMEPEAIGGEMEGAGLYSAAHRRRVDWIIFKSIVDWGLNKTDDHQVDSSSNASQVLFEALQILTKE